VLGSLRFRLPALFLLGIVLAATVATLIARSTPAPPEDARHRRVAEVHALLAKRRPTNVMSSSAA